MRLCQENLKKIATALEMYATDHSGYFPGELSALAREYIDAIPHCPAGQRDTYSAGYQPRSIYTDQPDSYTLHCHGHHHERAKLPADLPSIDPRDGLKPQLPFQGTPAQALEKCQSNTKNIATALEIYASDNQGRYPGSLDGLTPNYLGTIPPCPVANKDTYSHTYRQGRSAPGNDQDYRDYYHFACSGDHSAAGPSPKYDSVRGLGEQP